MDLSNWEVYLTGFIAMFIFVFFKAFQQRNVAFDHYAWVIPISWCMSITEIFVISLVVINGFDILLGFAVGTGGGVGALGAMLLHKKYLTRKQDV